ncbi:hypothetical protein CRG98_002881 [Punica granatum]|uniref:Uncharacterized protein n=1 Tax=Punica granatum TaxID=22663 RepID=A0A2I0L7U4_PUNGR|nr:hypothetical protein CRG98_002881 [Punica granatum]
MMRGGGKVKGSGQSGRQEEDQEEGVGDFEIDDEDELKESGDTAGKWSWKRVFHELVSGKDDESMSRSSRVWRNIRRYGSSSSLPLPDRGFVIHPDEWYLPLSSLSAHIQSHSSYWWMHTLVGYVQLDGTVDEVAIIIEYDHSKEDMFGPIRSWTHQHIYHVTRRVGLL